MVRWALTGANGFVGRALADRLRAEGHPVRGLTRRVGSLAYDHIVGDVTDQRAVAALVERADVVVHLAAYVHKKATSEAAQRECREVNVDGANRVAQAVFATGGYLVLVSTANVYAPSEEPATEKDALKPRTLYGETKLEAEENVRALFGKGLRGTIVRPAMVFGPGAPGNLRRLVGLVQRRIIPFVGTGANRKTMAPIGRLIAAIRAVADDQQAANGKAFNVGGITLSMRGVVKEIGEELGIEPRIIPLPKGPMAMIGRLLDRIPSSRLPSLSQMVETFTSSSVVDDHRLQALATFRDLDDPHEALRHAIRDLSASQ
jgi:nucleoside-diphosphate-sugar epimerase